MDLEQRIARIEEKLGIVSKEKTTPEDDWVTFQAGEDRYRIARDGSAGQWCLPGSGVWIEMGSRTLACFRAGRRTANKELAQAVLDMSNVTLSAVSDDATWNEWSAWEHKVLSLARAIVHEEDDEGV